MPKLNLCSRFWKPPELACHRGHPCSLHCKYLENLVEKPLPGHPEKRRTATRAGATDAVTRASLAAGHRRGPFQRRADRAPCKKRLGTRGAHRRQPLQGAQDLRLIIGEMAHEDFGVPDFPEGSKFFRDFVD